LHGHLNRNQRLHWHLIDGVAQACAAEAMPPPVIKRWIDY
jgi:hypothetical protein